MDLETRTFQVELDGDLEDRTVIGRAVPYNTPTDVGGYKESFQRGAFGAVKKNLPLLWAHSEPVGKITATRDADDGLHIAARISQTPRGEEVLTLLRMVSSTPSPWVSNRSNPSAALLRTAPPGCPQRGLGSHLPVYSYPGGRCPFTMKGGHRG